MISRIRLIFLNLLFILTFACSSDENSQQKVIERSTFIEILAEVQIFESTQQFVKNKNLGFDLDKSYDYLFEKYNINREDFEKSLEYYSSNPEDFEQMYDEVIVILTEKQAAESQESL